LEAILDFLTLTYQCRVPRKPGGRLTLGELFPGISKKLRGALRVEVQVKDAQGKPTYEEHRLGEILDKVSEMAPARNVFGAHFNKTADWPDVDAIRFATLVHELAVILIDGDAGWPRSDKSGSYWATAGETRRLHPLKEPS
jgi:hypothetical protein